MPGKSVTLPIIKRIINSLLILLAIIYLTLLGLQGAQLGRQRVGITFIELARDAFSRLGSYLFHHPDVYLWRREVLPAGRLVSTLFLNSASLLLVSLLIAGFVGVLLGSLASLPKRRSTAPVILVISILGVSTPSFLLGMFFWIANVGVANLLKTPSALLPPTGFGFDLHLILPALVLAARPMAQIMQITYVSMSDALRQEYIRAAQARGAPQWLVIWRHALGNVRIPILTTLGTSLRYSLASLPVVEVFFVWPGLGLSLLQAIALDMPELITDLIASLGLMFLLINLALDFIYPILDPRLRQDAQQNGESAAAAATGFGSILETLGLIWVDLCHWVRGIFSKRSKHRAVSFSQADLLRRRKAVSTPLAQPAQPTHERPIWLDAITNPPLVLGLCLALLLVVLGLFGGRMTSTNPYETHGIMMIEGEVYGPPFEPSSVFPWGSDAIGRDVQALVLNGARLTLSLALFSTLARVLVGVLFGMAAGWWQHSWLDKLMNALISVWAAFPVTIFAAIVIYAMGIERGLSIFILALCVVGWGEIAQFVRSQVIAQKPQLYIEAARSEGAHSGQLLIRHILPHLLPAIVVMATLEMGSVLMLLAELGFLNIFVGGGFAAEIGSGVYYYSDVPEWGSLLANIRNMWRSYPWMAWYPGVFFFTAILAFNVLGEGLRRFLEQSRLNLARLINRYTVLAAVVLIGGTLWLLRSTTPLEIYRPVAQQFDARRALVDIEALASPEFQGRETGTEGNLLAARYIASRMEEIGLFPGGEKDTYLQGLVNPRFHLAGTPRLEIVDSNGEIVENLVYRQDFVEAIAANSPVGEGTGTVVGYVIDTGPHAYPLSPGNQGTGIVYIIRATDSQFVNIPRAAGVLIIAEDPETAMQKRYLYNAVRGNTYPVFYITPQLADRLLAPAGSSVALMDSLAASLEPDSSASTGESCRVHLSIPGLPEDNTEKYYNVIGYIPGSGGLGEGRTGLDSKVIIVSAYFDGLGVGPDGTFYPGANDNASGVAAMLEIARLLQESDYPPKKTVLFVAWSGGQRYEGLSIFNAMNAKTGFGLLDVEAVVELSGVGGGAGTAVAIGEGSSFRLVSLAQDAASRLGVSTTNRGRGPHFGVPDFPGFGGRTAMSLVMSWDGSDQYAFTTFDTADRIEEEKMQDLGELATLLVSTLSREENY